MITFYTFLEVKYYFASYYFHKILYFKLKKKKILSFSCNVSFKMNNTQIIYIKNTETLKKEKLNKEHTLKFLYP